jgi:hypothetical protein
MSKILFKRRSTSTLYFMLLPPKQNIFPSPFGPIFVYLYVEAILSSSVKKARHTTTAVSRFLL